jgi:hypothetical protein
MPPWRSEHPTTVVAVITTRRRRRPSRNTTPPSKTRRPPQEAAHCQPGRREAMPQMPFFGRAHARGSPPTTRTRRRSFFVQLPCSETAPKAARGPAAAIMEGCPDFRQPPPAAAGKGSGGGGRRGPAG